MLRKSRHIDHSELEGCVKMKITRSAIVAILVGSLAATAQEAPRIAVIDSATPAELLLAKPGTFLGETFVFAEQHSGDVNVQVGVWEAGQGEFILEDFPFTEYVLMLSGRVIVTEEDGTSLVFSAGDTFVIPKGWSGD